MEKLLDYKRMEDMELINKTCREYMDKEPELSEAHLYELDDRINRDAKLKGELQQTRKYLIDEYADKVIGLPPAQRETALRVMDKVPEGADRKTAFETLCGGKTDREGFRKECRMTEMKKAIQQMTRVRVIERAIGR